MQALVKLDYIDLLQPKYLSREFLSRYSEQKSSFSTDLGIVVFLRTYSRFIPDTYDAALDQPHLRRREKWWEMCARVVEYSMSLYQGPASYHELRQEAEELYDHMYSMKVFTAGRTMWVGGSKVVKAHATANFNCSARVIDSIEAYPEMFYLLLVGAGVGYSVERKYIEKLPKLNPDVKVVYQEYKPKPKNQRRENTKVVVTKHIGMFGSADSVTLELGMDYLVDADSTLIEDTLRRSGMDKLIIHVGDSKEGWCTALKTYLHALTCEFPVEIHFIFDSIRGEGERLHTMGGRASGPLPLRKMFEKITWTIKRCGGVLGSTEAGDIGNFVAEGVVVGGVRRSSQLQAGDLNDTRFVESKFGLWSGPNLNEQQLEEFINLLAKVDLIVDSQELEKTVAKLKEENPWLEGTPINAVLSQFDNSNHYLLWSDEFPEIEQYVDKHDPMYRYRASRVMSNNSVHLFDRPSNEELQALFGRMKNNGEPGLYIAGNAEKRRPNYKLTNPCLTKDTWVHTEFGARQISEIIGQPLSLYVNGKLYPTTDAGFFKTGHKAVYELETVGGYKLRLTENHQVLTVTSQSRHAEEVEWVEAKNLQPGDLIKINDHRNIEPWYGDGTKDEGWLIGNLIGNGCLVQNDNKSNQAILRYWGENQEQEALEALTKVSLAVKHRSDLGVTKHKKNNYSQISSTGLYELAERFGVRYGHKQVTDQIERSSYDFYRGFIQGFFDADGTVVGTQQKGVSVRLSQSNLDSLQRVQRMLLRLGIASTIYQNRKGNGYHSLPDGKGGLKSYFVQANHELVISGSNLFTYYELIGFSKVEKQEKLVSLLNSYKRRPNQERFVATINSITYVGEQDVYDCTVPEIHRFDANGLVVHNCGEILLDSSGVCNLTEVNVLAFVLGKDDFDYEGFARAVALAARVGSRITNVNMWHPNWDYVQKRDRLLGVSLTGQVDAWDALGWGYTYYPGGEPGGYVYINDERIEAVLQLAKSVARETADNYHEEMGIPRSLLVTTGKPSGSVSQLPTVSSGCHRAYAPYYLRRIRVSKADPVAKALRELGVPCVPENNQGYDLDAEQCNTWVFTFPVKTGAPIRAIDERAVDQLERYKMLMNNYIEHNQSITVTVAWDEWDEVVEWLSKDENWNSIVGVSFLSRWDPTEDESPYPNLPYQPSNAEEYKQIRATFSIDENQLVDLISKYEQSYEEFELMEIDCSSGACPIR